MSPPGEADPTAIHQQLVAIAQPLSSALTQAIIQVGPIALNPRLEDHFAKQLCRAITGQQLSVRAAETIWGRVVASAPVDTSLIAYFAAADPIDLRSCGLSAAKAKAVNAIALADLAGQLNAAELSQLDHLALTKRLTALWGVGQWTADMMGIFYFGKPDIWPEGDLSARKTLERLTSARRKTIRTAARFAPYRSYLALYLWQYADAGLQTSPQT
jgi:DNA-3-methyladenine glycosylase II